MRLTHILFVLPLAVVALAVASPQAAKAQDYDMDCKLLLCLPGGFPDGCGDAYDHMIDRIRDGKSPIGTCAMAGGGEYDDYEIDYDFNGATSRDGWQCPEGTRLFHESNPVEANRSSVQVFCYENSDTVRLGDNTRTYYTGMSRPDRTHFTLDMTMNASAETPYETGVMRFSTGRARDWMTDITYGQ
ncbi:MAG: hypothetical protein CMJ32_12390 [Phycisphaerae bacterium]|nr:hypothetical protein [Phycisphaerae bacterium]